MSGEGRFRDIQVINCADDGAAIVEARRLVAEHDCSRFEVWEGERLLTFDHHG
jgi:hypothetical protein